MMRVRRTIAAVSAAACMMCMAFGAEAAPVQPGDEGDEHGCIYPSRSTVLGYDRVGIESVEFQSFMSGNRDLRWLFISSDGPADGTVFVLTCGGRVVAKLRLGYVRRKTPGPWIDGHETLQVIYVSASGTGIIVNESVALLQFDGTSIVKLWDHDSDDAGEESNADFGGPPGDERWVTGAYHYDWRYSKSGKEIAVSGKRAVELGGRIKNTKLPREKFCYRVPKHQFLRCR